MERSRGLDTHVIPHPVLQGSLNKSRGGESGLCSRTPQQPGSCEKCNSHCREGEHRLPTSTEIELGPQLHQAMQISKEPAALSQPCISRDLEGALLSGKEQARNFARVATSLQGSLQHAKPLDSQGDVAGGEAWGDYTLKSYRISTHPPTRIHSQPRENGIPLSCRGSAGLPTPQIQQHISLALGSCGPGRGLETKGPTRSSEIAAERGCRGSDRTSVVAPALQSRGMLIGASGGPGGKARGEVSAKQNHCGSSHIARSMPVPPVGHRRHHMGDATAAPSTSRQGSTPLLETSVGNFQRMPGERGPPLAVSAPTEARGRLSLNVPPAQRLPSTGRSRVTRSQTAAAAMTEVVRIEDSSDEEEKQAAAYQHGADVCKVWAQDSGESVGEAADGQSAFISLLEPSGGMRGGQMEAATACLILVAALVGGDGHCCVLNAETLSRVAAEYTVLQPPQQHSSSTVGVSASPDEAHGLAAHKIEEGTRTAKKVLVLQANPGRGDVSLDLWEPPSHPAPAPEEGGKKQYADASLGRPAQLASSSSLLRLLCFPKSMISRLRWLGLGAGAAARGWACCSGEVYCCCCRGSTGDRRSLHARRKDRKHSKLHSKKAHAKPEDEQTGMDLHSSSDRQDVQTVGDNGSSYPGEDSASQISGRFASSGVVAASLCSPSVDATQPIRMMQRDGASTTRNDAGATGDCKTLGTSESRRSSTHSGSNHNRLEGSLPEVLGRHSGGGHHKRRSGHSSTKKRSSTSQSKSSQKSRRERDEHPSRKEGPLGIGLATRGDSSRPASTEGLLIGKKDQIHGIATPRNALIVTDGKPLHGAPPPQSGMTPSNSRASTHCEVQRDEMTEKSNTEGSSDRQGTSNSADGLNEERLQYLTTGQSMIGSILAMERTEHKEQQRRRERQADERRSSKEVRPKDADVHPADFFLDHSLSCRKCRKSSGRHDSSDEGHVVPVLCLELLQSQEDKLECSELLQKVLEQEKTNSMCCIGSSLQQVQHHTGNSHGEICKTSAGVFVSQHPMAYTKSSTHGNFHTESERNSRSSKSRRGSNTSRSTGSHIINNSSFGGNSSINGSTDSNGSVSTNINIAHCQCEVARECRAEGDRETADRPHSSSSGKRTSRPRSSTSKYGRSSSSGRHCRSSSSRRKKSRREVSPASTAPATAAGYTRELCYSRLGESSSQRDACGDRTADTSSTQCTQNVSLNIASSVGNMTEGGPCHRVHFRDGSTPKVIDLGPSLELPMAVQSPSLSVEASGESLPIKQIKSAGKRGPWLLLCVGPALHIGPSANNISAGTGAKQADSQIVEAEPVRESLGCFREQSNKRRGTGLRRWEEAVPTGYRNDCLSLFKVLLPSSIGSGALLDHFLGSGAAGEPIDVVDLVAFFTKCIKEQKKAPSENQANGGQLFPDIVSHISRVLNEFFTSSLFLWKALQKGRNVVSSFSIECLVSFWRARGLQCGVESQRTARKEGIKNFPLVCATPVTVSSEDTRRQASARPTATAPSPVFDLLLDDRTLRRLSEKEFLDDTIIDFCLGFIVDHILSPDERLRVHISNTFFLSALMEQKCEMEAHTRLTRWLKKELTPLPKKDFIFIPVHHKHQHWSLAVVVYPWRAINPSQTSAEHEIVRRASEKSVCKPEVSKLSGAVQQPCSLEVSAHEVGIKMSPQSRTVGIVAPFPLGKGRGVETGQSSASLRAPGPHAQRPSREKARLFHVDSMGLRSVFDRCRGRLKRFLRQEFEHRCGGELKSGVKVELCTDSCCWHDGHSCTLHTPRQQNGYDCGVFVVEYVYFLTRNLSAIETLLVGPSRDCHSQHRNVKQPTVGTTTPSTYGCLAHVDAPVEARSQGKLLKAALGFHCPCMEAGLTAQMRANTQAVCGLHSNLKARLAELRQAHAALFGSSKTSFSRQRDLRVQAGSPTTPPSVSQGNGATHELTPQPVEKISCSAAPHKVPGLQHRQHFPDAIRVQNSDFTDGRASQTQQCPVWGPLPLCASKRRSSHNKWFSQERVTQRRLQLHKMLLFMRQNIRWREDPRLVAHLKSLFLNIGS